jgi:hypothetical protein
MAGSQASSTEAGACYRPQKLCDSCSACAASKVKCPRDTPSCSRCTKRGTVCEYPEVKRAGRAHKPRQDRRQQRRLDPRQRSAVSDETAVSGSRSTRTDSTSTAHSAPQTPWLDSGYGLLTPTLEPFSAPLLVSPSPKSLGEKCGSNPCNDTDLNFDLFVASLLTATLPAPTAIMEASAKSPAPPAPTSSGMSVCSPNAFATEAANTSTINNDLTPVCLPDGDIMDVVDVMDFVSMPELDFECENPVESSGLDSDLEYRVGSIEPLAEENTSICHPPLSEHSPPCDCFMILLKYQQKLHSMDADPRRMSKNLTLSTDRSNSKPLDLLHNIIALNEEVLHSINSMLDCQCVHGGFDFSIVSIIMLKVLDQYASAALELGKLLSQGEDESDYSTSSGTSCPTYESDRTHEHYEIKGYPVGSGDMQMVPRLVLGELHAVRKLLGRFAQRTSTQDETTYMLVASLSGMTSGSISPVTDIRRDSHNSRRSSSYSSFDTGVLERLEDSTRQRLRQLSDEIMELLRDG